MCISAIFLFVLITSLPFVVQIKVWVMTLKIGTEEERKIMTGKVIFAGRKYSGCFLFFFFFL
jgi:hypothetical protein